MRWKDWMLVLGACWAAIAVEAAEFEDFVGGVSTTRVTVNPASVGAINRLHFQYDWKNYEDGNRLDPFTKAAHVGDDPAFLFGPDHRSAITSVLYDKGKVAYLTGTVVLPMELLSLGIAGSFQHQHYDEATYLGLDGKPLDAETNATDIQHEINTGNLEVLLGMPFEHFSLGVSVNRKAVVQTVTRFDLGDIISKSNSQAGGAVSDTINISGNAIYNVPTYGLILPDFFGLDLGLTYRPATRATMKLTGFNKKLPNGGTFKNFQFEDPEFSKFGIGYIFDLGNYAGMQLLGDVGNIANVTQGITGETGKNGATAGGLLRFAVPPYIDLTLGSRFETLSSIKIQTDTVSLQFPFLEGTNLKLGWQKLTLSREGETIAEISYPKFSINLQIGSPTQRPLIVPPKTKKIRFIDRL